MGLIRTVFQLVARGVRDLTRHPGAQLLTLAAVTLVAFLAGLFLVFLHNLNVELERSRGEILFQVYWRPGVEAGLVQGQWAEMDHLPYLLQKTTFTPEQGLSALAEHLGGQVDLSWLKGENPLPFTALLSFSPAVEDPGDWTRQTLDHLTRLPGVEKVHYNQLRTDLANAWARFSQRILWPLVGFLVLVLALVVGNTIKLSLLGRRTEIEIFQLVGAKNWYIQLPLLAGGAVQGLLGGLLALGMLKAVQASLEDLLNFPPLFLQIRFLPLEQAALVVAVPALVALASSWVAARS